jgi:hypothetical protein
MKNKIAFCAAMALLFAPSVSHSMRWGTEFTGSSWTMDGKDFLKSMHTYEAMAPAAGFSMTGKITQGRLGGAAGVFVEGNSRFRLGAAVGYGVMPAVSSKFRWGNGWVGGFNLENKTTYIPLDLYLKYTSREGKFSLFGGGGADYVMASTDFKGDDSNSSSMRATFTEKKLMPHVQAGCELFLAKWISLDLSAKYLFNAVLDNLTGNMTSDGYPPGKYRMIMADNPPYGEVWQFWRTSNPLVSGVRPFKYDLSGLRANIGFRVYFK